MPGRQWQQSPVSQLSGGQVDHNDVVIVVVGVVLVVVVAVEDRLSKIINWSLIDCCCRCFRC